MNWHDTDQSMPMVRQGQPSHQGHRATLSAPPPGSPRAPHRAAPGLPMPSRPGMAPDLTPPSPASSQPTAWNRLAGPVIYVRLHAQPPTTGRRANLPK